MLSRIKRILKSESGSTLVVVLAFVIITSIAVSALLMNSVFSTENSQNSEKQARALEAARGGVEHALYVLDKQLAVLGEDETLDSFDINGEDGLYAVDVTMTEDSFSIESKAPYTTMIGTTKYMRYVVNGTLTERPQSGDEIEFDLGDFESVLFEDAVVTSGGGTTFTLVSPTSVSMNGTVKANSSVPPAFAGLWTDEGPISLNDFNALHAGLRDYNYSFTSANYVSYDGNNRNYPNNNTNNNQDTITGGNFGNFNINAGTPGYQLTVNGDLRVAKLDMRGAAATLHVTGDLHTKNFSMEGNNELNLIVDGDIYINGNVPLKGANNNIMTNNLNCNGHIQLEGNNNKIEANIINVGGHIQVPGNNNEISCNVIHGSKKIKISGVNAKISVSDWLIIDEIEITYSGNNPSDYYEINAKHIVHNTKNNGTKFNLINESPTISPILTMNITGLFLAETVTIARANAQIAAGYIAALNNITLTGSGAGTNFVVGGIAAKNITITDVARLKFGATSGGSGGSGGEPPEEWQGGSFDITDWGINK